MEKHMMNKRSLQQIKTRNSLQTLNCRRCGRPIEEGDAYISRPAPQKLAPRASRYYHAHCWNSLFLETKE
jgi:hypothetical protein